MSLTKTVQVCNTTQGFGAAESQKQLYLHSQFYSRAFVPDPFAIDSLKAKPNPLVKSPFKQNKTLANRNGGGGAGLSVDAGGLMGAISSKSPHDALRQKTVMEIAMAAHATQRPYPNVKIVSPYPGRLLKARYKRMQKEPDRFEPRMESCAGIGVKTNEGDRGSYTRNGLSTRVRKHCQDHQVKVIRHFLEDQTIGNLEDASIADSVSLYKQKGLSRNFDFERELSNTPNTGRNSPVKIPMATDVWSPAEADDAKLEDDSSDIEQYQINYLPEIDQR